MNSTTKVGPEILKNKKFNIPVYNATHQMYECIDVLDITEDGNRSQLKTYSLKFQEVKNIGYDVSEFLELRIFIIHGDDSINATLSEHNGDVLGSLRTANTTITSMSGLQSLLRNLAQLY
jgi:hypothetical protein